MNSFFFLFLHKNCARLVVNPIIVNLFALLLLKLHDGGSRIRLEDAGLNQTK